MKKYLLVAVLIVLALTPLSRAFADVGATVITINTPVVSGTSVSITGTANSGTSACNAGGVISRTGPLCNCCPVPPTEPGAWATCQIDPTITYSISGPITRQGNTSITSSVYSPSGCVLQCSTASEGNQCRQAKNFSLSEANLLPGNYSVTVTTNDCRGTNSASKSVTIPSSLTAVCWAPQTSYVAGTQVKWQATVSGGSTYTYTWSGTDGLIGATNPIYKTYTATGTKTANLTVTSGGQTKNTSCSVAITAAPPISPVLCSPASQNASAGNQVSFTAASGTPPYSWSAPYGSPNSWNGVSFATTFGTNSAGLSRIVTVTDSGGGTSQCTVSVQSSSTPINGTITVNANVPATWSLVRPQDIFQQTVATTSAALYLQSQGTYQLTDPRAPGYSCAVRDASSRTIDAANQLIAYTVDCTPNGAQKGTPSVILKANGVRNSITIISGQSAQLTWSSADVDTCTASGAWSGTQVTYDPVGKSTGVLKNTSTYTLTCTGPYGSASDAVVVNVSNPGQTGTISVVSNVATTWSITGPNAFSQSQGSPSSGASYTGEIGTYTITNIPVLQGYSAPTVTPSSSQTLGANSTITFTIYYGGGGGGGGVACTPSMGTGFINQNVLYSASGGSGAYSWYAPGGQDETGGNFNNWSTSWPSNGLKTVTVTRGSSSATCYASISPFGNDVPQGTHDLNTDASCSVAGWAVDPDNRATDLSVRIYSDGVLKKTTTANLYRADLTGICSNGTCGFVDSLAGLITTGVAHSITAKAVDAQTGVEQTLAGSPKTINCPAPIPDYSIIKSSDITAASGKRGNGSTAATISVLPVNGFLSTVALSATSSLDGSVQYTFSPASLSSAQYSSGASFTVTFTKTVNPGAYPITVRGVGGGLTRTRVVNLNVATTPVKPPPVFEEF